MTTPARKPAAPLSPPAARINPPQQLLTVQEAADELRLGVATIRSMCRTGVLHPTYGLGGRAGYRIARHAIDRWLGKQLIPEAPDSETA